METPQLPISETEGRPSLGLGYFMVLVRRLPGTPAGEVTGIVERLGTGEKRPFRSSGELAQVVAEWSSAQDRSG